jgi:DNA-binding SARP family transcriptional activator
MADGLAITVLGPVRAWVNGAEVPLGPVKRRSLLALLALRAGQVVSRDEIVDGLWAQPPAGAAGSVYTYVNGLRSVLEPGRGRGAPSRFLLSAAPGYRLAVEPEAVDATRFTAGLDAARTLLRADLPTAQATFEATLALWRDPPLSGLDGPFAQDARLRLTERWTAGVEDRAAALLDLGAADRVPEALAALVDRYPLRERPLGLLMLALHRLGRSAEALSVFTDLGQALAAAGGPVGPSEALHRLADQIGRNSPALDRISISLGPRAADTLPPDPPAFTGRAVEVSRLRALRTEPEGLGIGVISGGAGVGKTALAVHAARALAAGFPDGTLFVDLGAFGRDRPRPPTEALATLLTALGATDESSTPAELAARYRSALAGRRVLLVLDNAESSDQVRPLLPGTPSCLVLVTSRYRLTGLVARDGARLLDLDPLRRNESRTLLGRLLPPGAADADAVAGHCADLPLALVLAAERIRAGGDPAELADPARRLDFLDSGERSVREHLSWSYRTLPAEAAALFRDLGRRPALDTTTDGALTGELDGDRDARRCRRLLETLAAAHLLEWSGRDRFRLPPLTHCFAAELAAARTG